MQISDATTGTVLDTETVSSFSKGVYLQWAVSGDILITLTKTAGPSALLSGLFFDPAGIPGDAESAASELETNGASPGVGTTGPGNQVAPLMGALDFIGANSPADPAPSGTSSNGRPVVRIR